MSFEEEKLKLSEEIVNCSLCHRINEELQTERGTSPQPKLCIKHHLKKKELGL